jgi:uncharacterized HhH-GPD family protein
MSLHLAQQPEADELLERNPFALVLGMLLDQQVPIEWAFSSPLKVEQRLGGELTVRAVAEHDPDGLIKVFAEPPATHRYPKAMAVRAQALARFVMERYDGDMAALWTEAKSGKELFTRLKELPGFGEAKAQIFLALLGKQLGVQPRGWRTAAGAYGKQGSYKSVADIVDPESLQRVRDYKAKMKAAAKAAKAKG